jgi:aerobic-type carbon monoxide dehydrogenase small subunit (CoxS/CutS family)
MVAEREKKTEMPVDVAGLESITAAQTVRMKVNGRYHNLQVEPNATLRDVLRQKLGLTSIKDFCNGYGACGSCTVIMDGRPILSCMLLAIECEGVAIETAEGIADARHPLIEAYIMNWTAQCGYCTPGFLVTAKSLLDHNLNPTEEEIKEALAGNLCRCGSYPVHIKAIQQAAKVLRGE